MHCWRWFVALAHEKCHSGAAASTRKRGRERDATRKEEREREREQLENVGMNDGKRWKEEREVKLGVGRTSRALPGHKSYRSGAGTYNV